MPSFRHLSRVVAMQTLFEFTMRNNDLKKNLDYNLKVFALKINDTSFLEKLVFGVSENRIKIDTYIEKYAPEWPICKLALVERVILEIGLFELIYMPETPVAVVLNEAIEIAKTYGDESSGKFINGVLSTVSKNLKSS